MEIYNSFPSFPSKNKTSRVLRLINSYIHLFLFKFLVKSVYLVNFVLCRSGRFVNNVLNSCSLYNSRYIKTQKFRREEISAKIFAEIFSAEIFLSPNFFRPKLEASPKCNYFVGYFDFFLYFYRTDKPCKAQKCSPKFFAAEITKSSPNFFPPKFFCRNFS